MRWSNGLVPRVRDLCWLLCLLALPAVADRAYVTCQNGDALGVIDLSAGETVATWDVPGKPAGVAVTSGSVFTVSADSKTVHRFAPASGAVLAERRLDGGPMGVALDAARGRLFVSDWYEARIRVLRAEDLMPLGDLATGAAPAGLALSPDGAILASADRDADQVSLFDAETLAPLRRPAVGTRPFGLAFAPDGRLFVANVGSNDVTVLDPASGETLATVPVGDRPYGVAFAQGRAFVSNQYAGTVSVIDLATLAVVATIPAGEYPEGIDATPDARAIVLANWFDNTVSIIDAKTLSVVREVDTCDGPRAFGAFVLGGNG